MNIGVLGTGMVGKAIGTKLVVLGHEVRMGSRTADNEEAAMWVSASGSGASQARLPRPPASGTCSSDCTAGSGSLEALRSVRPQDLAGKVLIDVANPLDSSQGMPLVLFVSNTDSLGEQIQRAFPETRVVKALQTMNCEVMVDPGKVPGEHDAFVCGNDETAKGEVRGLLESFGWPADRIVDLGDITSARGTEMYLPLWLRLWGALRTGYFNIRVVR
jgi:predicted dinucleotide-binding enzyme